MVPREHCIGVFVGRLGDLPGYSIGLGIEVTLGPVLGKDRRRIDFIGTGIKTAEILIVALERLESGHGSKAIVDIEDEGHQLL